MAGPLNMKWINVPNLYEGVLIDELCTNARWNIRCSVCLQIFFICPKHCRQHTGSRLTSNGRKDYFELFYEGFGYIAQEVPS